MSKGKITPNNILHFNKKTKKEEKEELNKITLDNLVQKASSDNVSDALKNLYGFDGVIKDVKPLNDAHKVSGFIRTVETNSNDWGTCIKGIYECKEDEILFIKCSNDEIAVWGELASTAAREHGVKATVLVGSARDTEDIIKTGFPVFSSNYRSNAGLPYNNGVIGENIILDDYVIKTGDFAVCDRDGVVIIPSEKLEEVLVELNKIKKFEENCIKQLLGNNKRLDDIVGF